MTLTKPIYTTRELAELFSVQPLTIDTWRKQGKITALKLGGTKTVRFTADAVHQFIAANQ